MDQQIAQQTELFAPIVTGDADAPVLCACGLSEQNRIHSHSKNARGYHAFVGECAAARFHRANPHVIGLLAATCRRLMDEVGANHIGFRLVWETARHDYRVRTRDVESTKKLNNNYQSWYSREIMARYPDLAGTFHTRDRAA